MECPPDCARAAGLLSDQTASQCLAVLVDHSELSSLSLSLALTPGNTKSCSKACHTKYCSKGSDTKSCSKYCSKACYTKSCTKSCSKACQTKSYSTSCRKACHTKSCSNSCSSFLSSWPQHCDEVSLHQVQLSRKTREESSASPSRRDQHSSPWRREKSSSPFKRDQCSSPSREDKCSSPSRRDQCSSPSRRDQCSSPSRRDQCSSPSRKDQRSSPSRRDRYSSPWRQEKSSLSRRERCSSTPRRLEECSRREKCPSCGSRRQDRCSYPTRQDTCSRQDKPSSPCRRNKFFSTTKPEKSTSAERQDQRCSPWRRPDKPPSATRRHAASARAKPARPTIAATALADAAAVEPAALSGNTLHRRLSPVTRSVPSSPATRLADTTVGLATVPTDKIRLLHDKRTVPTSTSTTLSDTSAVGPSPLGDKTALIISEDKSKVPTSTGNIVAANDAKGPASLPGDEITHLLSPDNKTVRTSSATTIPDTAVDGSAQPQPWKLVQENADPVQMVQKNAATTTATATAAGGSARAQHVHLAQRSARFRGVLHTLLSSERQAQDVEPGFQHFTDVTHYIQQYRQQHHPVIMQATRENGHDSSGKEGEMADPHPISHKSGGKSGRRCSKAERGCPHHVPRSPCIRSDPSAARSSPQRPPSAPGALKMAVKGKQLQSGRKFRFIRSQRTLVVESPRSTRIHLSWRQYLKYFSRRRDSSHMPGSSGEHDARGGYTARPTTPDPLHSPTLHRAATCVPVLDFDQSRVGTPVSPFQDDQSATKKVALSATCAPVLDFDQSRVGTPVSPFRVDQSATRRLAMSANASSRGSTKGTEKTNNMRGPEKRRGVSVTQTSGVSGVIGVTTRLAICSVMDIQAAIEDLTVSLGTAAPSHRPVRPTGQNYWSPLRT